MARTRSIKPGFFTNEELAACPPLTRLLFAALWCLADREGRLEDRPKRIKAEALPYDDCDVDAMLNELHQHGFITRYIVDNARFIEIPKFAEHQRPHKEKASVIPPYQQVAAIPGKSGNDPEKSGNDPDFSGNALRAFHPSTLPPSGIPESPGRPASELDSTPEGIAQRWCFLYRGTVASERDPYKVAPAFAEWLRLGLVTVASLRAEIERKDRDRTEPVWGMKDRLIPRQRAPGAKQPASDEETPEQRAERLRKQKERIEREKREAGTKSIKQVMREFELEQQSQREATAASGERTEAGTG